MTGKTHFLVGMNAVWILPILGYVDEWSLLMIPIAGFAGLLPDIDAKEAEIHDQTFNITKIFQIHKFFGHRKFFHSILATVLIFLLFELVIPPIHPGLPWVIALAYASHNIIDAFNAKGVCWFWPWNKFIYLFPSFLRSPVGGWMDDSLFVLAISGVSIFTYQFGVFEPVKIVNAVVSLW